MMTFPVSGMILQLTMINRIKKDVSLFHTIFPMTFLGSCVISKLYTEDTISTSIAVIPTQRQQQCWRMLQSSVISKLDVLTRYPQRRE